MADLVLTLPFRDTLRLEFGHCRTLNLLFEGDSQTILSRLDLNVIFSEYVSTMPSGEGFFAPDLTLEGSSAVFIEVHRNLLPMACITAIECVMIMADKHTSKTHCISLKKKGKRSCASKTVLL